MATTKKPVAKTVTNQARPGQFSESGKQPKFVPKGGLKEMHDAADKRVAAKKAAAKKPATASKAKPVTKKSVIKTESTTKTAVKAVKDVVKKAVAKVAPPVTEVKQPVKRVSRKIPVASPVEKEDPPKEREIKAPWESVEGEKLKATLPAAERLFPLVPLMVPGRGTEVFSHTFEHNLNINGEDHTVTTGYLSVNRSLDLLGLSMSDEMIGKGFVDPTDTLHKKMKLASLHIQVKEKDKFIDCTSIVHEAVEHGDFRTVRLELTIIVNEGGKNYAISVEGNINLEMGSCYLSARSHPDVEVKGYFLDGSRCNFNRQ